MADADLAEVGLRSGLAIHRQLLTEKALVLQPGTG